MNKLLLLTVLISCKFAVAQEPYVTDGLPFFKQIGHSLMPPFTSDYFFFSHDGLLWFSSAKGLTSFDGSEVVYYNTPQQAFSYGLNKIVAIAEDANQNMYLGTGDRIIYFDRSNNQFSKLQYNFANNKQKAGVAVNALYIDKKGILYAGFTYKGLLIYTASKKTFENVHLPAQPLDTCRCDEMYFSSVLSFAAHATDSDKLWLGTYNGVFLYDKKTMKVTPDFTVENPAVNNYRKMPFLYDIRKMDVESDSIIWFNTTSFGFGRLNTNTGTAHLFLHNARINEKDLWKAYTLNGFSKWGSGKYVLGITAPSPGVFDTKTGKLELFNVINAPDAFDEVEYISNDHKGNIWVLDKGLLYASVPDYYHLKTVNIEKQLTHDYLPNQFGGIYFDKEQSLYYASVVFSSGVYVLDTNFNIVKILPSPLYTNRYTYKETANEFIAKDGSNRIWTTCLGTYILKPGAGKFDYASNISPKLHWLDNAEEMLGICTRKNGDILLRTIEKVIYNINHKTFDTDTIRINGDESNAAFDMAVTGINYDSARDIVYLNDNKSISRYDFRSKEKETLSPSLLVGNIAAAHQTAEWALDARGDIWVCIPDYGVRIIDPDKLICIDSIPYGKKGLLAGSFNFLCNGGTECMFLMGQSGIVIYNYKKQQSLWLNYANGANTPFPYFTGYCNNYLFTNKRNRILYFNLADFDKFNFTIQPLLNTIAQDSVIIFTRGANDKNLDLHLQYSQNSLSFSFSAQEFFSPERIEYAYLLDGVDDEWHYTNSFNRKITYSKLKPGHYTFKLRAQLEGGVWSGTAAEYTIIIAPPFWQTWWFWLLVVSVAGIIIFYIAKKRVQKIRKQERLKIMHEKELLELEAKALRAQMNPHFIFNCMNSIKALMQEKEEDKAVNYLTTFSKLIRTIFQNSDKREITLFDEIETCKLYVQLESLRFGNKFNYTFNVDETLDLKSVMVPALIMQPFIENSIWHGIMPKKEGGALTVTVQKTGDVIRCSIEDNGIGREMSKQNKFKGESSTHQSKGVHLTQSRLNLDNLLNERNASVETIDKKDENGKPSGTEVVISFNEY